MEDPARTLPPTSGDVASKTQRSFLIAKFALGILTIPYRRTFRLYTWKPIREIRAASGNRKVLLGTIRDFKANKYNELQSVQVAVSLQLRLSSPRYQPRNKFPTSSTRGRLFWILNHPQASFCAGATLATISWRKFANPIWVADALWFSSLICGIWAVVTSIQAKSMLDDLPSKEQLVASLSDAQLSRARLVILRYKKTPGVRHWIM